jgi:hypothetical protein
MRESFTYGSVRGAARKGGPYRDPRRNPANALTLALYGQCCPHVGVAPGFYERNRSSPCIA